MLNLRTLDNIETSDKRILLRVDLNVPMRNGSVIDDTRVKRIIPTIEELLARGASVILLSHLGRPEGKPSAELSLRSVADVLKEELAGRSVIFVDDVVGERAKSAVDGLRSGDVLLLENLRFDPGEETNDRFFAERLASFGDVYIDDAFFMCAPRACLD